MIRIGTSGLDYKDWIGPLFPLNLHPKRRLEYYAQYFQTVELNVTFYSFLSPSAIGELLNTVQSGFHFFIQAHRDLTHGNRQHAKEIMKKFIGQAELFREAQKLGGVLIQFPEGFEYSQKTEDYLRWLVESLEGNRVAIEFRHARWINNRTMGLLRELNAGYSIIEIPQVKNYPSSRIEVTSDFAYVRFHGQNRAKWQTASTRNERYDYDYSDAEIQDWVPRIAKLSKDVKDTYVYYNNHDQGKAAKNAKALQGFLESFTGSYSISAGNI